VVGDLGVVPGIRRPARQRRALMYRDEEEVVLENGSDAEVRLFDMA